MRIEKNATGGRGMLTNDEAMARIQALDSEDCDIAIAEAQKMAERFKTDMAICRDLSVVALCHAQGETLETIRFRQKKVIDV